ncbi:MAG: AbrB/MazE/SpoVT family DNA-binding domain-containing protein [Segetibacter sp.]|jgi:AbrB family looped-hinge helix DNA binding protein|nr:AbrB/MazE/SpoVT family DNA-binding domain-containing protein [Segetibacter sp.]
METSILTSKGQLLIPKRLRTKYGINSGVKIVFEETEKGVLITPMNEKYFKSFAGILKGDGHLREDMKHMKDEEKKLEDKKLNIKPVKK